MWCHRFGQSWDCEKYKNLNILRTEHIFFTKYLCFTWYILRSYCFVVEVTFNLLIVFLMTNSLETMQDKCQENQRVSVVNIKRLIFRNTETTGELISWSGHSLSYLLLHFSVLLLPFLVIISFLLQHLLIRKLLPDEVILSSCKSWNMEFKWGFVTKKLKILVLLWWKILMIINSLAELDKKGG